MNAVDPATGVIPYSFACTIANTQGVIPHGLTERHFVSYRPAKKRASNHWCEELLNSLQRESSGNLQSSGSGRDSGMDSAEEEVIRRILIGEKKRETKRRSSPKKEGGQTGSQTGNEGTPTKKLKKKTSTDGTSSGDSGRETPTSSEPKEISLKEWFKDSMFSWDRFPAGIQLRFVFNCDLRSISLTNNRLLFLLRPLVSTMQK